MLCVGILPVLPKLSSDILTGSGYSGSPVIGMATQRHREVIDSILGTATAARILPSNLKLRWEVKPQEVQYTDTATNAVRKAELYTLIALKSNNGKPALAGDVVVSATSDFDNMQGNYVSMDMNSEGAKAWARVTQNNLGKPVAIVLDEPCIFLSAHQQRYRRGTFSNHR